MLDPIYLQRGLDALCRAHAFDYFADGHRGGAIVSAYFFCREEAVEADACAQMAALIDAHWTSTPLCAPFADEAPIGNGTERIVKHVEHSLDHLRQAGHNVILPSLALKAFAQRPDLLPESRVSGLCKMINAFTRMDDVPLHPASDLPSFANAAEASAYTLGELLACMRAFDGRGQGWSGHLLTYSRALLDLRALGHDALAARAEHGFALYIDRIRMGPLDTDLSRPEHARRPAQPHQADYWHQRSQHGVSIGHLFKYPYGFYGLMRHVPDGPLSQACWGEAYRIF